MFGSGNVSSTWRTASHHRSVSLCSSGIKDWQYVDANLNEYNHVAKYENSRRTATGITTAVNAGCGLRYVVHMTYVKHKVEDSGLLGYHAILATSSCLEESECPRL